MNDNPSSAGAGRSVQSPRIKARLVFPDIFLVSCFKRTFNGHLCGKAKNVQSCDSSWITCFFSAQSETSRKPHLIDDPGCQIRTDSFRSARRSPNRRFISLIKAGLVPAVKKVLLTLQRPPARPQSGGEELHGRPGHSYCPFPAFSRGHAGETPCSARLIHRPYGS